MTAKNDMGQQLETQTLTMSEARKSRRKKLLSSFGVVILLTAFGWWGYISFLSGNTISTKNAYTGADLAEITSQIMASVVVVLVSDTQQVKRGDILVRLDDTDTRLAVTVAEAELANTQRTVKQLFANDEVLASRVEQRRADVIAATADLERAHANLKKSRFYLSRRSNLSAKGAISQETLLDAETDNELAQATVAQAQARITAAQSAQTAALSERSANAVLISGSDVDSNPRVAVARARLDQARTDYSRTVIRAPIDGIVSQRSVEIGQLAQQSQRLMTIVPIDRIYVDANFREGELAEVRPGQSVKITSDLYGHDIEYRGRVVGLSGGSGSAFAVIPAQNATGNWIKVVQRLPVRIELDRDDLKKYPLRVGLSMHTTINLDSGPGKDAQ